ncbi:putative plant organelle RNA recognition domain-containing protein [Helianthus annuus]|nr:putative plant organelle RNA recognition domain-containing protein [Helianthus annuus]KAJ0774716.1 putative plant organelle RNA recognition domain-containing protein [Helianthus annuus]
MEIVLFPCKSLRLRRKILDWLDGFQKLPYVSPYEECLDLRPDSDLAEKRVVGLLHELLSLFVEHSAERKKLLCLRKYLGLPQQVHKVFERHPCVVYLSLRNNTCTTILKEAYCDKIGHPLATVRKRYINLLKESKVILKNRRLQNHSFCSGEGIIKGEDDTPNISQHL